MKSHDTPDRSSVDYDQALALIREHVAPLNKESVPLHKALGRILAQDIYARVNVPSVDTALRDGYALACSQSQAVIARNKLLCVKVIGSVVAGQHPPAGLPPNTALEVTTGAPVPRDAYAVVEQERCQRDKDRLFVVGPITKGQHIRAVGADIAIGMHIGRKGQRLTAGLLARIASAGHSHVQTVKVPTVGVLATGDELVEPGARLRPGQVYTSNTVTIGGWLDRYVTRIIVARSKDRCAHIERNVANLIARSEVLIITGGTSRGHTDKVKSVLEAMGWSTVFSGVKIRPGMSTAFGMLRNRPVVCLPGSPTACEISFLTIALPIVLHTAGWTGLPFCIVRARAAEYIIDEHVHWRRFKYACLFQDARSIPCVVQGRFDTSMEAMSSGTCLLVLPEGLRCARKGRYLDVYVFI